MRARRAVAAVVLATAALPWQMPALAATAPAITSLSVADHVVDAGSDALLGWVTEFEATMADVSVDFVNDASGDTVTVSWSSGAEHAGDLAIADGTFGSGIYYAQNARISDSAGGANSYGLYEDAPLLDDTWFAVGVDAPTAPTGPRQMDALGGPDLGEIAILCGRGTGFGLPILEYIYTLVPVDGGVSETRVRDGMSCYNTLTGLTPGKTYDVTITARTAVGVSGPTGPDRATAGSAPPSEPTYLSAVPGDQTAHLEWQPADGFGLPITDYAVEVRSEGGSVLLGTSQAGNVNAPNELDLTDLTNGVAYDFRVQGRNSLGWGSWSAWSDPFTPLAHPVPAAPSFQASWTDTEAIAVEWVESSQPEGDPPTSFEIEVSGDGRTDESGEVTCCSWTTIFGVDVDEVYVIRMRAKNSAGWSDWSSSYTLTPVRPPSAVQSLDVSGRYQRAEIGWEGPLTGSPEGGYLYSVTEGSSTGVAEPTGGAPTNDMRAVVAGLTPGKDYVVSVWAVGELGRTSSVREVVLTGTRTTVRASTALSVGQSSEVRGRSVTETHGTGLGGITLVLQRRSPGALFFRATDMTTVTGPEGRFRIEFSRTAWCRVSDRTCRAVRPRWISGGTTCGWRFGTFALRPVTRSGRSSDHEQRDLDARGSGDTDPCRS